MMYVCLVYTNPATFEAMSEPEIAEMQAAAAAFDDELKERGHLVFAEALQGVETATTFRFRNGKMSATDGPFAETAEQLGGMTVVEARDLNEVMSLLERDPMLRFSTIEVRPVYDYRKEVEARAAAKARAAVE